MRIVEFVFNMVDAFAPMNDLEKAELRQEANLDYLSVKDSLRQRPDGKPGNLKERALKWAEYWPVRLFLAVLFIWWKPRVQDYFDGGQSQQFDDDNQFNDFEIVE